MYKLDAGTQPSYRLTISLYVKYIMATGLPPVLEVAEL